MRSGGIIFIIIAGNIGAGKTTLTQLLSKYFSCLAHLEKVDGNPYLSDFYRDMKRWSFSLQICFLVNRFKDHQKICLENKSAIQDRSIYEDANIFTRNLFEKKIMDDRDYKNYIDLYHLMCEQLIPPDLIVYLKTSVPILKKRIIQRGRAFEKNLPEHYLESLNNYYDEWIESYNFGKKLTIPNDDLDFLNRPSDLDYIIGFVRKKLGQGDLFLDLKT